MARKREKRSGEDIELHRMDGPAVSLGCETCMLLYLCGGNTRVGGGMCETCCSKCDRATCDVVCLGKPEEFARAVMEIGGFDLDDIGTMRAPEEVPPPYVPMVYNGSSRQRPLREAWAAIPLRAVLQHPKGGPKVVADSPAKLREMFKLQPQTKVLLVGIDLDHRIERFWKWHDDPDLLGQLGRLGVDAAIVPNYSFSLRHPRPQHLFNRKRSLICAREWSAQGIPSVPCIQAVTPRDWEVWREFLGEHTEISMVAKEFLTGAAVRKRGRVALQELARLQDALKRPLHLLARGGAQYRAEISRLFEHWTLVDSSPFIKAVKQQKARLVSPRVAWDKVRDYRVDALLAHNVGVWRSWLAGPSVPASHHSQTPKTAQVYTGQYRLPGT
jgi:hypothetical protein